MMGRLHELPSIRVLGRREPYNDNRGRYPGLWTVSIGTIGEFLLTDESALNYPALKRKMLTFHNTALPFTTSEFDRLFADAVARWRSNGCPNLVTASMRLELADAEAAREEQDENAVPG